jgi:hypothetical protein
MFYILLFSKKHILLFYRIGTHIIVRYLCVIIISLSPLLAEI